MPLTSIKTICFACFLTLLSLPAFAQRPVGTSGGTTITTEPQAPESGPICPPRGDNARRRTATDNRQRLRANRKGTNGRPTAVRAKSPRADKDNSARPTRRGEVETSDKTNQRSERAVIRSRRTTAPNRRVKTMKNEKDTASSDRRAYRRAKNF